MLKQQRHIFAAVLKSEGMARRRRTKEFGSIDIGGQLIWGRYWGKSIAVRRAARERRGKQTWPEHARLQTTGNVFQSQRPVFKPEAILKAKEFRRTAPNIAN